MAHTLWPWEVVVMAQAPSAMADAQQAARSASSGFTDLVRPAIAGEKTGAGQAARMKAVLDEMERADRALPHDAFDPAAVITKTGKDRTAIFNWVRDQTAFVPYRGSLRGPVGVLFDRLGNSLDRALLLADLLERAGLEVRLANGPLEPAARQKIEAAMSARARPAVPVVPDDDVFERLAPAFGVTAAQMRTQQAAVRQAQARLATQAQARIAEQTTALAAAVPAAKMSASASSPLDDHWWVQAENAGGWIDLDPALPSSKPGDTYAQALTTLSPKDLDDERRHTLTIRVMAEVWRNGARSQEVLLEHTFAPSQFYGQDISFSNRPIDWPDTNSFLGATKPVDLFRKALVDQVEWLPVLRIGKGSVVKQSIDDSGDLYDNSSGDANTMRLGRNVQKMTERGVGGATDLFGSLPGGANEKSSAPHKQTATAAFTSEWIEFDIKTPGAERPVTAKRVVFDLMTPQQRAGAGRGPLTDAERAVRTLSLIGEMDLLPIYSAMPAAYVAHLATKRITAVKPAVLEWAKAAGKPLAADVRSALAAAEPAPGPAYLLGMSRFSWGPARDQVFVDRLNLVAYQREFRANAAGFVKRDTFDFIANGVGVFPRAGSDPYRARLTQGVADTVIEAALLGPCPAGTSGCSRGANTSEIFARVPQGWFATTGASAASVARVPAPLRDRIRGDLEAGYTVLTPGAGAGAAVTWWRIDPRTGESLGLSDSGGGQAFVEYLAAVLSVAFTIAQCLPILQADYAPGSYGDWQASACGMALGITVIAAIMVFTIPAAELGAAGVALGIMGDFLTVDWRAAGLGVLRLFG